MLKYVHETCTDVHIIQDQNEYMRAAKNVRDILGEGNKQETCTNIHLCSYIHIYIQRDALWTHRPPHFFQKRLISEVSEGLWGALGGHFGSAAGVETPELGAIQSCSEGSQGDSVVQQEGSRRFPFLPSMP